MKVIPGTTGKQIHVEQLGRPTPRCTHGLVHPQDYVAQHIDPAVNPGMTYMVQLCPCGRRWKCPVDFCGSEFAVGAPCLCDKTT